MRVTFILWLLCLILIMSQTHSQASNEKTGNKLRMQDSRATVYIYHSVVVGDQKGQDFDEVGLPVFSPDGNKVAYWARNKREIWWKVLETR